MAKADKEKGKQKLVSSKSAASVSGVERIDPSSLLRTFGDWVSSKPKTPSKTASLSPLSINNHAEEIKEITLTLWDDLFLCIDDFTENAEARQKIVGRINQYYKDIADILGKNPSALKSTDFYPALEIFEELKEKNERHHFNHIRAMFLYVDTLNSATEWLRQSECLSKPLFYGPFWQPNALMKNNLGYYQPASEEMVEQEALSIFKIAFCDRAVRKSLMRLIVKQLYTLAELENSFFHSLTPILFQDYAMLVYMEEIPAEKFQLIHTSSDACRILAKNSRPLLAPDEKEFEELTWEIWPKEKNTELLWNNLKLLVNDFHCNVDTREKAVSLIIEYYTLLKNIKAQQEKKAPDQVELKESDLTTAVCFFKSYIKDEEFDIICSMVLYADILDSKSGCLNRNYYLSRQLLSLDLWKNQLTKAEDKEKINERIVRIFRIAFNNPAAKEKLSPLLLQDLASSESGTEDALKKCIENFTSNILFPDIHSEPMPKSDEASISMSASLETPSDVPSLKSSKPSTLQKLGDNARKVKGHFLNSTSPLSSNRQLLKRSLSSRSVTASASSEDISNSSLIATPIENSPATIKPEVPESDSGSEKSTFTGVALSPPGTPTYPKSGSLSMSSFHNIGENSNSIDTITDTPNDSSVAFSKEEDKENDSDKSEEKNPAIKANTSELVARISPFPSALSELKEEREEITPAADSNIKNEKAEEPDPCDKSDGLKRDKYELVEIIHHPKLGESDDNDSTSNEEKKESPDESISSVQKDRISTVEIVSDITKAEATKPFDEDETPKHNIDSSALINSSFFRTPSLSPHAILDSLSEIAPSANSAPITVSSIGSHITITSLNERTEEDMTELSLDDAPSSEGPSTPPSHPFSKLPNPKKALIKAGGVLQNSFTPHRIKKTKLQATDNTTALPPIKKSVKENTSPSYTAQNIVPVSIDNPDHFLNDDSDKDGILREMTYQELLDSGIDPKSIPYSREKTKKIWLENLSRSFSSIFSPPPSIRTLTNSISVDSGSNEIADSHIIQHSSGSIDSSLSLGKQSEEHVAGLSENSSNQEPSMSSSDRKDKEEEIFIEHPLSSTHFEEPSTIIAESGVPYKDVRKQLLIKVISVNSNGEADETDIQRMIDSPHTMFPPSYIDENQREVFIEEEKKEGKITFTATEMSIDKVKTTTTFTRNDEGTTDVAISGQFRYTIDQTVNTAKELFNISGNPIFCFGVDISRKEIERRPKVEARYFSALLAAGIIPIFEKYKQEKELGVALRKTYHDLCAKDKDVAAQYSNVILNHSNETLRNAFKAIRDIEALQENLLVDEKGKKPQAQQKDDAATKGFLSSFATLFNSEENRQKSKKTTHHQSGSQTIPQTDSKLSVSLRAAKK